MRRQRVDGATGPWLGPFIANARNPDLRRAQLGFAAAWSAEWAFTVGLSVEAYRDAGPTAVGLVAAARLLPAALAAPLLLPLADRFRRDRLLAAISTARAVATAASALLVAIGAPTLWVYALAVVATVAATLVRPVHSALLPSLCHRPHELASANAVRGLLDSASVLVGPAVAALLLEVSGVAAVFFAAAASSAASAAVLLRVRSEPPQSAPTAGGRNRWGDVMRGVATIATERGLRTLVMLAAAQAFVRGGLTVFTVVVSVDVLHTGYPGVGSLTAAVGGGAVLGSVAVSRLIRTRRLARWFGVGAVLWGVPLALVATTSTLSVTCAFLAVIGVGNALVDVGLFTLMARLADDAVLARVFGVLEGVVALSVAAGGVVTPALIHWSGVRPALVIVGLLTPAVVTARWTRLIALDRSLDVQEETIDLLREVPMLAPLSLPLIEQLARHLVPANVAAGTTVFVQGDAGDSFYVIRAGTAEVTGDGRHVRDLARGDGFGEIALLRDVPRTASVTARTPLRLESLGRDEFLRVVTGYRPSSLQASADVQAKLDDYTPG